LLAHYFQYFPIHLFRWNMTEEPAVIHYIAGLSSHKSSAGWVVIFIYYQTSEKRLPRHNQSALFCVWYVPTRYMRFLSVQILFRLIWDCLSIIEKCIQVSLLGLCDIFYLMLPKLPQESGNS
jgi:hypothetical protein